MPCIYRLFTSCFQHGTVQEISKLLSGTNLQPIHRRNNNHSAYPLCRTKLLLQWDICTFIIALCTSCSVSKFIPEDKYLLDEVRIVSETKEVKPSLFNSYIRQNPNAKWFNLVKIPMRTYCVSGVDSTKWINRFFRKIGDAPVI